MEAFEEIYNKHMDKMICSKHDISNVASAISYFEKRKMNVSLVPMPVQQSDGIKMTFAFIMPIDKKVVKKNKKSISNNKYILFNSWYTKNKQPTWPSSPVMWNNMKNLQQVKPFVALFEYMERLGKSIKKDSALITESKQQNIKNLVDHKNNNEDDEDDEVEEKNESTQKSELEQQIESFNAKRLELYQEFYRVLNAAFHHGAAPTSSFIYDIKLPKTLVPGTQYEKNEYERLTRSLVQNSVETFKSLLQSKLTPGSDEITKISKASLPPTPILSILSSRKRKNIQTPSLNGGGGATLSKQQKVKHQRDPSYTMIDDDLEESQMSTN